jgi:hypothetical protein
LQPVHPARTQVMIKMRCFMNIPLPAERRRSVEFHSAVGVEAADDFGLAVGGVAELRRLFFRGINECFGLFLYLFHHNIGQSFFKGTNSTRCNFCS